MIRSSLGVSRSAPRPLATALLLAGLSLLLAACLLMPGHFTSDMDVHKDGQFSFRYNGEVVLLPLGEAEDKRRKAAIFAPSPCHGDDDSTERACTREEIAAQRKTWEDNRREEEARRKSEAAMSRGMFGGIDPDDPRAAEQLAQRLRRQAGWRSVTYKGHGVYLVDFAIAGRLDHDFTFPTIEGFPMANAFVQVTRRTDGSVRVDAPGFGPAGGGSPMQGLMQMGSMAGSGGEGPKLPDVDGTFLLRTDAQVLANNTDEGPQSDPGGQRLEWQVNARTPAAPTALLKLAK